jgi:hypothetical protein
VATFWLTVAAVLLFGASLAEAQRAPTAENFAYAR